MEEKFKNDGKGKDGMEWKEKIWRERIGLRLVENNENN